jgi:ubiquinone/menaquinone biosynthesis C-methylase UbiE
LSPDPRVAAEFTRQAEPMAASAAFRSEDVLGRILRAMGPPPFGRVLDLACGPGIVAETLAPLAEFLEGVDATPRMVELAAARLRAAGLANAAFRVGAAESLPFGDAAFDAVVTRLSFHHFPDPAAVLGQVRRVLRPGGRLVAADVVSSEDAAESALHNALERLRDPTHERMLAPSELRRTIGVSGFRVVAEETWRQPRGFSEWAGIVADPVRTGPLKTVMAALARAGCGAGLAMTEEDGEPGFEHTWLLVVARRDEG